MGPRAPSHASGARLESGSSASGLRAELAALDQAQAALGTDETARALQILDAYEARFPRGALAPEATVLRIEALVKAGQSQAAKQTADGWLAQSPDSPYAGRIRALLSNP